MKRTTQRRIPRLRFAGFGDGWRLVSFYNLAKIRRGLTYHPADVQAEGIRVLRSSNIVEDYFSITSTDIFVRESAVNMPLARDGDILITAANGSTALVGKHSVIKGAGKAVHGGFMLLAEAALPFFVNALMSSQWYCRFINAYVLGGNGAIGNLRKDSLGNQMVRAPHKIQEQEKIGSLFCRLDHLEMLHRRKLEKLRQLKKALLEKIFPKRGQPEPEMRFAGFKGEWRVEKFKDIFLFLKNNTLSRDALTEESTSGIRNIHYGDILIKWGDVVDTSRHALPYVADAKEARGSLLRCGDIVISDTAEDSTVGKCVELLHRSEEKIVPGLHTMPCRPLKEFAPFYLGYFINSDSYHGQLLPLMQGIKVISISRKSILETDVKYPPKVQEQGKLGSLLHLLDHLVAFHRLKLEKLQYLKKALLARMFVNP